MLGIVKVIEPFNTIGIKKELTPILLHGLPASEELSYRWNMYNVKPLLLEKGYIEEVFHSYEWNL